MPRSRLSRKAVPSLPGRVIPLLVALAWLGAAPASPAPLHPDLHRTLEPGTLARIPPEPPPPRVPGVLGAAAWGGRHAATAPRALVLLADFSDRPASLPERDPEHFRRLFFSVGETEFGSLREYYREATRGALDVDGGVHGWFRLPRPLAEYARNESGLCLSCYPFNARGLAADAVAAALEAGVRFADYDSDGPDGVPSSGDDDGILDALLVVHAGTGTERSGLLTDIRSHYLDFASPLTAAGVLVPDYLMVPELENVGVAVHEFGHLLGAEDLYDLSGRAGGLGYYSIMAWSLWQNNARQPGGPDPFTRMQWGFLDLESPGADEPVMMLPAIDLGGRALRLWTRGEAGPEYFLVEARRPRGIDRYLPGDGLLVYHVDERVTRQDDARRWRVGVVQADGLGSLEGGTPRNLGEPGDFFPGSLEIRSIDDGTVPSTRARAGTPTGVALRRIGDAADTMRFAAEVGRSAGARPDPFPRIHPEADDALPFARAADPFPARVEIANRGSRLPDGVVRLVARDGALALAGPAEVAVPSLGPFARTMLPATWEIRVAPSPARDVPLVVEAEWRAGGGSFPMVALVPIEGEVAAWEGGEAASPAWSEAGRGPAAQRWRRQSDFRRSGSGAWGVGGRGGYGARLDVTLTGGPFAAGPRALLTFRHLMRVPAQEDEAYDGGFVEISADGETWIPVVPDGGYSHTFLITSGIPYPGRGAWSGMMDAWEEATIRIEDAPESLRVRYRFLSDYSSVSIRDTGWFVDDILLRSWRSGFVPLLDPPRVEGRSAALSFSAVPALDPPGEAVFALRVESPIDARELGRWTVTERLDRTELVVPDLTAGQTYRVLLDRLDPPGGSPAVREFTVEGGLPGPLDAVPATLARAGGPAIPFRVDTPGPVRLEVFDARGARVALLVDEDLVRGIHRRAWPERGESGRPLAAGVYFLRLAGPAGGATRKVVLVP